MGFLLTLKQLLQQLLSDQTGTAPVDVDDDDADAEASILTEINTEAAKERERHMRGSEEEDTFSNAEGPQQRVQCAQQ